jgi:phosphotriesterase-related protein
MAKKVSGPTSTRETRSPPNNSRRDFLTRTAAAGIAAAILRPAAAVSATSKGAPAAQTVLGPLDASKLGFTLPHEHIADAPAVLSRWPKAWGGRAEFVAKTVEQLKLIRAAGVSTIVDLAPYDVWRDIEFLEEVSRKSGLHMIAATGQRFFPPITQVAMPARSIEGLAAFFQKEIEQGINGTGVKAGVIKIGVVGKQTTVLEEVGLRAGARASKASGAPMRIHSRAADKVGESLAVILAEEGVEPARVSFDHSDDSGDMDYFLGLARQGYSLGMDHVHRGLGPEFKPVFERRTECIKLLCDAGFADRIFLSQDSELGGALLPEKAREWRETIDPPEGLLFTTRRLIPHLKQIGVSVSDIRTMTVENPRRFFSLS